MVILTWSRSHVLAILAAVNGAMTVPQYGYDQAPIWKNKTCFEHGTYGLSKDGSLPKHRDGFHTKWWFGAPKVLENSTLAPPPMPPSSNFNITLVGFRYILSCYLGFGEHACTHHYHICVKLWDLPPLQVPYTLLLAGCIAISVLKNPASMKSWLNPG